MLKIEADVGLPKAPETRMTPDYVEFLKKQQEKDTLMPVRSAVKVSELDLSGIDKKKITVFTNGIILDGNINMQPVKDAAIFVYDGKILGITEAAGEDFSEYTVEDLGGKYIMPGLINLHVHIPASGKPKKKPADTKKLVKLLTANKLTRLPIQPLYDKYVKAELMSGVTTIRSVGGVENYDTLTRDRIAAGKAEGPRIFASDMAVSVPGGHMAGSLAYEAHNPGEAVAFVDKIAENKPDLIKLMITGGVLDAEKKGEPGVLRMHPDLVRAACDEAHRLGLPVAAHVESAEGIKVALANGVDTIEHGAMPDDEVIALFKYRNAALVATISPTLPYALFDREISHIDETAQFNGQVVFNGVLACAKACLENGITVGLGTDTGCPFITHYDMWRELYNFTKFCGVSNSFALHTATMRNAAILGKADVLGSIEPGKFADFIVSEGNPLDDLTCLRKLSAVVINGRIIREPKVKKFNKTEKELDKLL